MTRIAWVYLRWGLHPWEKNYNDQDWALFKTPNATRELWRCWCSPTRWYITPTWRRDSPRRFQGLAAQNGNGNDNDNDNDNDNFFWTWNQRIYHYCKKNSGFGVTMSMTMRVLHRSYLFTPEVMDICANACEKHWVNASNSQLVCPSLEIFSSLKLFIIQCAQLIKEALDSR